MFEEFNLDFSPEKELRSISEIENNFSSGMFRSETYDNFEINFSDIHLEEETQKLFQTYNETFRRLYKGKFSFGGMSIESQELDFSPLISLSSKAFETEMNLSLMQWVRALNGIEMPTYFNAYKKGANVIVGNINLNETINNSWKPIALGNARAVFQSIFRQREYPKEITNPNLLLELWEIIYKYRNKASHTGCCLMEDFIIFHKSYSQLIESGIFSQLIVIKSQLRGIQTEIGK